MKILMTGFDPFGGEPVNPAWEAVSRVTAPEGVELTVMQVPTVFEEAGVLVKKAMEELRPDYVVSVGQAAGRAAITPERVAINVMDARIPDNALFRPVDEPIEKEGPAAYFSTLPIKAIRDALNEAGIPSAVSDTAGTFVCNSLMYHILHKARELPPMRAGFVHIPCIPEQLPRMPAGTPAMELGEIVRGLETLLSVLAKE